VTWDEVLELAALAVEHGLLVQLRTTDLERAGFVVELFNPKDLNEYEKLLAFAKESGCSLSPVTVPNSAWSVSV